MQKHHWQIVAGAFAGLLLVTNMPCTAPKPFPASFVVGASSNLLASCRCDGVLAGYEIDLAY
ncbi:hypothetical protein Lpp124_08693 [Lacticaseibacillus paracasei subsp. paracasei CNCM I-4649]|nr:hypothetical protein Lpp124_08693 [Lacticaseibacillus paracasei subsp. paracasei CNCM I-4649]